MLRRLVTDILLLFHGGNQRLQLILFLCKNVFRFFDFSLGLWVIPLCKECCGSRWDIFRETLLDVLIIDLRGLTRLLCFPPLLFCYKVKALNLSQVSNYRIIEYVYAYLFATRSPLLVITVSLYSTEEHIASSLCCSFAVLY
jgi:hypothetical protein